MWEPKSLFYVRGKEDSSDEGAQDGADVVGDVLCRVPVDVGKTFEVSVEPRLMFSRS